MLKSAALCVSRKVENNDPRMSGNCDLVNKTRIRRFLLWLKFIRLKA